MQVTSTSYRAYALDLWGFGDSAHNVLKYSLDDQASLLDRFLIEMGIGKIALVGHGLGALVGMTFANRFPQNVDRMMAVNCPLHINAIGSRMRTASPSPVELTEWLSTRTPEATTALADSGKADGKAIADSLADCRPIIPLANFATWRSVISIPTLIRQLFPACLFMEKRTRPSLLQTKVFLSPP